MKKIMFITFLAIMLAACGPATTLAPTETPVPTFTPVPPTATPTIMAILPTPLPTQLTIPMITPDAIQVERWKEYQTELAKRVLSDSGADFPYYETAVCEWDILGRSGQEVYVWAICSAPGIGGDTPAAISLVIDGSIQKVKVPGHGSSAEANIQRMFPADVREKIVLYSSLSSHGPGRVNELILHLQYRVAHPEELPLIVLSTTPQP